MTHDYTKNENEDIPINSHSHFDPPLPKISISEDNFKEVASPANIAVYDDLLSAPRIVTIKPDDIHTYLDQITTSTYKLAKEQGGEIAYTVIREVVENFIHAYFKEPTISIINNGNTIRFSDQGPGIANPELAYEVGYTSATSEMKKIIRGVGSGLPIASEYLTYNGGYLEIDKNIDKGTVVTISLVQPEKSKSRETKHNNQNIEEPNDTVTSFLNTEDSTIERREIIQPTKRELQVLDLISQIGAAGPTEVNNALNISMSTAYRTLDSLEEKGLVDKSGAQKKRFLTEIGEKILIRYNANK